MAETVKQYQQRIGKLGGYARAKILAPERRTSIAKIAAHSRWERERKKKPAA